MACSNIERARAVRKRIWDRHRQQSYLGVEMLADIAEQEIAAALAAAECRGVEKMRERAVECARKLLYPLSTLGEIARVDMGRADAPLNKYRTVAGDMAEWCYAYKRHCPELDTPYVPGDCCTQCPFKLK